MRFATELRGHTGSVDYLCWSPEFADELATCSADSTVRIWDYRSAKETGQIAIGGQGINLAWSPDGKFLATGSKDDRISIIDMRMRKILKTWKEAVETNEIAFSHASDLLLMTTGLGQVKILSCNSFETLHTLNAHTSNCFCLEFDPCGKYLAVGGADAITSLWTLDDWVCVRTFTRLEFPVRTLSFSYDSQYIASASEDHWIDISNVETGEQVYKLPTGYVGNCISWHPSRNYLAFAGEDMRGPRIYGLLN